MMTMKDSRIQIHPLYATMIIDTQKHSIDITSQVDLTIHIPARASGISDNSFGLDMFLQGVERER